MRQRNINIDFYLPGVISFQTGFLVRRDENSRCNTFAKQRTYDAVKETGAMSINGERVSEEQILDVDARIVILKKLINDPKT